MHRAQETRGELEVVTGQNKKMASLSRSTNLMTRHAVIAVAFILLLTFVILATSNENLRPSFAVNSVYIQVSAWIIYNPPFHFLLLIIELVDCKLTKKLLRMKSKHFKKVWHNPE